MAIDSRRLLEGLREYHKRLIYHLARLQEEFRQVETRWDMFSSVYGGNAADQFRAGWERTGSSFQEYLERGRAIAAMLRERIAALEEADRARGGF